MLILLAEKLETSLDSLVGTNSNKRITDTQIKLVAEAPTILNKLDEAKLKAATLQLKALLDL